MQDTYALLDQHVHDSGKEVAREQSGDHRFQAEPCEIASTRGREGADAADLNGAAGKFAKPPSEPSSGHIDNCTKPVHTRFVIYF